VGYNFVTDIRGLSSFV